MINTPVRRTSLRRKRCPGSNGGTESPLSKRVSPSLDDEARKDRRAKDVQPRVMLQEKRLYNLPTTPQRIPRKGDERGEVQHAEQYSPDTPFLSSQLCGTQECEVVWDCNSPGFSKDDLKRMSGDDKGDGGTPSPVEFVVPAPHRMLFPRTRGRLHTAAVTQDTTAQLDELLNRLNTQGRSSDAVDESSSACESLVVGTILTTNDRRDLSSEEEEEQPSVSTNFLVMRSSQPFEVHKSRSESNYSGENKKVDSDESLWDDDLNVGICDMSGISMLGDKKSRMSVSSMMDENIDSKNNTVNMSTDVFDDDLFNDSVIRSTQAMEEAMEEQVNPVNAGHFVRNRFSGPRHSSVSEDEGVGLSQTRGIGSTVSLPPLATLNPSQNLSRRSSDLVNHKQTSISKNVNKKDENRMESVKNNPFIKPSEPNSSLSQVVDPAVEKNKLPKGRSSFQLFSVDDESKITNENKSKVQNNSGKNIEISQKITDTVVYPKVTLKPSEINKKILDIPKTNKDKTINKPAEKTTVVKGPPLNSKSQFLRSLSTDSGHTSKTKGFTSFKRINSATEASPSRAFEEDDPFFDAILSTLPENDMLLEENLPNMSGNLKNTNISSHSKFKNVVDVSDKKVDIHEQKSFNRMITNPIKNTNLTRDQSTCVRDNKVKSNQTTTSQPNQSSVLKQQLNTVQGNVKSGSGVTKGMAVPSQEPDPFADDLDMFDEYDDLFEEDVLSVVEEVESQFCSQVSEGGGSQPAQSQVRCTQDEIAKKKEAAQRLREERQRMRHMSGQQLNYY